MRSAERPLRLRHALVLGLAQGPAELMPISSSAHTALIASVAGWPYAELDPGTRKSFEVALHAGAGLALLGALGPELRGAARGLGRSGICAFALAVVPPALAGALLRGPVERRLGGPRSTAAGLLAGSAAMVLADTRRRIRPERTCADARAHDWLALGVAQALALVPGVSRSGATLSAARARGFGRGPARSLSLAVALPLLLGAGAAEVGRGRRAGELAALTGGSAAFASTLLSARVLRGAQRLLPYALYRAALAVAILVRSRRPAAR
ncbi:MAG TPA: undecaprenyl-diphosphate phosphatase [Solirubrobacteraceae bacterium]|jgi:undecaprenyl-diphosphatase|nr:undecaprenyl-diphosphate phosphatase [Solirubrobacteraceae bacterium]